MKHPYILILIALIPLSSCAERIKGNGKIIEVHHNLDVFDAVEVGGIFDVVLVQQKGSHAMEIVTDENIQEHIDFEVKDNTLRIGFKEKYLDTDELTLVIYFDDLNEVELSGAVNLSNKGTITGEELEIEISGAGEADLSVSVKRLEIEISGGAEILLEGSADELEFEVSGAGEIKGFDLKTRTADIDVTGAGDVELSVEDDLEVSITGAGDVKYIGDPNVSESIKGAGSVKQVRR